MTRTVAVTGAVGLGLLAVGLVVAMVWFWRGGGFETPRVVSGPKWFGVNMAGGEFGWDEIRILYDTRGREIGREGGVEDRDYLYIDDHEAYAYFVDRGLTLFRVPFRWERLQPYPAGPLDPQAVAGLRRVLDGAASAGGQVILEPHNFGRYYEVPLRSADGPMFADLWERTAREFRGHPGLWGYELMNEPHDLPEGDESWAQLAQAATDGLRRGDPDAWILVPGYDWSNAAEWPENNPLLAVFDPSDRLVYAAHLYMDDDFSGRYRRSFGEQQPPAGLDIGVRRLAPFQQWLRGRNARGMITEYGVPGDDARWLEALERLLRAIDRDPRLVGGAWWAAGPWWPEADRLSIQPHPDGRDKPQLAVLERHPTRLP